MKNFLLAAVLLCSVAANATELSLPKCSYNMMLHFNNLFHVTAHTAHWKIAPGANGGTTMTNQGSYVAGDTLAFAPGTQPRTYFTLQNFHGTAAAHITLFATDGEIEMLNGFSFFNCTYVDIDGDHVAGVQYGFRIHHVNDFTGDPIDIQGQSSHIKIHGFWAYHTNDGIRVKNDMQCVDNGDHWPYRMTGFEIFNFKLGDPSTFFPNEGMYLGNTDSYDLTRTLSCNGVNIHYRVSGLDSFSVHDGIIINAHRQGINFSGADGMYDNYFYNLYIENSGNGEANQGTALFIGSASRNCHVYNCWFNKSLNIGFHSYCEGLLDFHDNVIDSSGYCTVDGALLYTGGINNIEIDNFNNFTMSPTFQIQNNTLGVNTEGHNVRIDNDGKGYVGNNIICNSGTVSNPKNVQYLKACQIDIGEHDSTFKINCDSNEVFHMQKDSIIYDTAFGATKKWFTVTIKYNKLIQHTRTETIPTQRDTTIYYDSPGVCHKCGTCDSVGKVKDKVVTQYGLFLLTDTITATQPQKITHTKSLNLDLLRVNMDNGDSYTKVSQTIDSNVDVALTWNYTPIGTSNPFATDSAAVAAAARSMFAAHSTKLPTYVSWFNEEGNQQYNQGAAKTYLDDVTALTHVAHDYNIKSTDGGMTNGILYYMHADYLARGLTDSANWLETQTGITLWNGAFGLQQTGFYDTLVNGLAATGVTDANLHWYEPVKVTNLSLTTTTGVLPVVVAFIHSKTGLKVITTETGTRNTSSSLLTGMLGEWKSTGPDVIIYFDSNGTFAVKNENTFVGFVLLNP